VDSEVIAETGPPGDAVATPSVRRDGEALRIAWSGDHQPGKALPLLLRALALLPADVRWTLEILGKGPCTVKWQRLARKLAVGDRCTWHDWLPRDRAVSLMHEAHLFAITSVKDLTSTVVMEALSQGVPVVCPDHCGFSDVVTDVCGIKVPADSVPGLVAGFEEAILRLWQDEDQRRRLATAALRRAREFTFERKAEAVDRIYRRVVSGGDA
jgi:glycosyltransferase involved in cell wall biosynthesis